MEVDKKCCECNLKDNRNETSTEEDTFPLNLQNSLNSIIKKEGYETYNVVKRQISTDGGNYLGLLYEVDVKGKTADDDKETNIFIKNIISNVTFNILSVSEAYVRESFAYKELSKIFEELQDEANVPLEDRYKMAKSYDESDSEAIIMENLTRRGFKTGHRMDVMSLKFAELGVKQLAKFHAFSYVLQQRRPDYFENTLKTMKQAYIFDDEFEASVKNMSEMSTQALEYSARKKVDKFMEKFMEKFRHYLQDTSSTGCCVCHGDYRVNNILMKEIDGEITEIVPVDYQLLYYGCPLNDLLFFIFTATDQKFRKEHLTDLKDLYYDSLDKFLKYFDIYVENVFPKKEFERQFKERMDYGLLIMLFGMPFIFAEEDDALDFSKDSMTTAAVRMNSKYVERVRGLVDDFIQWGYL